MAVRVFFLPNLSAILPMTSMAMVLPSMIRKRTVPTKAMSPPSEAIRMGRNIRTPWLAASLTVDMAQMG
jgi:hypothetical protein